MHKGIALAGLLALLGACGDGGFFDPGTGTVVGQSAGKPLYSTSCDVDQSLVGKTGFSLGKTKATPFTPWHSCEPQAKKTCPAGYAVTDVKRGQASQRSISFQNGNTIQRRTFFVRPTTITYTCTG